MNIIESITFNDVVTEALTYGAASTQALATVGQPLALFSWGNGTGASQVDLHYEHTFALAGGASTTLTLSALADDLGRPVAFARIRKFVVLITARSPGGSLNVGAAATHPWTAIGAGAIPVGHVLMLLDEGLTAYPVAVGSSDQLLIANPGTDPITFLIALSGASA